MSWTGILAGLVSVSASCSVVEPYASAIIGAIGGAVYYASSTLIKRFQIDDPLDASPIHFFCGIWGVLSAGLFATPKNVKNAYGGGVKLAFLSTNHMDKPIPAGTQAMTWE